MKIRMSWTTFDIVIIGIATIILVLLTPGPKLDYNYDYRHNNKVGWYIDKKDYNTIEAITCLPIEYSVNGNDVDVNNKVITITHKDKKIYVKDYIAFVDLDKKNQPMLDKDSVMKIIRDVTIILR